MSKCSIFVSAISSLVFGGSDWTLAESTLSVFACQCDGGGDGGGGGCGRGDGGDGCGWVDDGGGGGGSAGHDGGGGGDFGGEECFHGLFMGLLLEVGCLPHFLMRRVGTFWSSNAPVLLY